MLVLVPVKRLRNREAKNVSVSESASVPLFEWKER